jgi:hypothetical protein
VGTKEICTLKSENLLESARNKIRKMHIAHMTGKAPLAEPAIHAGFLTFSLALRADGSYSPTRLNTPSGSQKIFRLQK